MSTDHQTARLDRRRFLQAGAVGALAMALPLPALAPRAAAAVRAAVPAATGAGVALATVPLGQVQLTPSRWLDNMNRTAAYLRFVDADRMLHMFRVTFGLPSSATPLGGWEAPDVQLRGHSMGHLLSGLALSAANTGDQVMIDKSRYLVAELAAVQAAGPAAGFTPGYLSAFGEQTFVDLESGKVPWAPYYTIHKIMAGFLDQHVLLGDAQALEVVRGMASWVDARTAPLSREAMQKMLNVEFGGMNELLVNLWKVTGDPLHLELATRFDHDTVFVPLSERRNTLAGRHANTDIPKVIGAAEEYAATGDARYRTIATYFWDQVVHHHTYVIGGNSNAEFFGEPGQIVSNLGENTCENCNSYNMIKLSRALFLQDPGTPAYMDYVEWTLLNQMLGEQDPDSAHGNVTYYTGLSHTASRKGKEGLVNEPGSYSSDYGNFSCDHGTGMETHSKFADSVWFTRESTAYLNLFIPSRFTWQEQGVTLTVETGYPYDEHVRVRVEGSGELGVAVRIPAWLDGTGRAPQLTVNGEPATSEPVRPGTYVTLQRTWSTGDVIELVLPMEARWLQAPDNPAAHALTYGPLVLAGRYGDTPPASLPVADPTTLRPTGQGLDHALDVGGRTVTFSPFLDVHHEHYDVYFLLPPSAPAPEVVARFGFDEAEGAPQDGTGRWGPAALVGGATRVERDGGSAVQLDGAGGHVALPAGLLGGLSEFTVSVWFRLDALANNSRVFDLGFNANTYLFLNPRTGSNKARLGMKLNGMEGEDFVDSSAGPLPVGEWTHVAATVGSEVHLYVDGELVGSNTSPRTSPLALGATSHNYLGKSQNVKHPYLPGAVDDFRLFGRALSADEIAALAGAPTDDVAVSAEVSVRRMGSSLYVAVRATNDEEVPVGITLETPYGSRSFTAVEPGRAAYQAFNARSTSVPAGEVTVTASKTLGDGTVSSVQTVGFDAVG
jgi:uncharacterized protein